VFLFNDDRYGHGYISWSEVKGMAKHWVKPLKDNADEQTRMVGVQLPAANYTKTLYSKGLT